MRSLALGVLFAFTVTGSDRAPVSRDRIAVVCRGSIDAYAEALKGIRDMLGRDPDVVDLEKRGALELAAAARRNVVSVYIAIGREALLAATSAKPPIPVVATMLLRGEAPEEITSSQVVLDVPPRRLIQELHRLFPQCGRIGLLVSGGVDRAAFAGAAKEASVQLIVKEVGGPPDLVRALVSLKGKADVVLTLPDDSLYNSTTVQALILASLESGVPIVGFSAAFVRAGAAAGIFADFRDAGAQAAENALHLDLNHPQRTVEAPRKLTIAVNQRIVRLLGISYNRGALVTVFR